MSVTVLLSGDMTEPANAIHEAKLSRETWILPTQAPAFMFAVNVAGFMATENVTSIVGPATGVAFSAGVVETTIGAPTHMPALSQDVPPFCVHGVPCARGGLDGVPLVQTSSVHSKPSIGKSVFSGALTIPPDPSHWPC